MKSWLYLVTSSISLALTWNVLIVEARPTPYHLNQNRTDVASGPASRQGRLPCLVSFARDRPEAIGVSSRQTQIHPGVAVCSPHVPPSFPASFYTGPLGTKNILPTKATGALLGLWPYAGSSVAELRRSILSRESALGRKLDLIHIHRAAPIGRCDYGPGHSPFTSRLEGWVANHGSILVMTWTHGWTIDEVNSGKADDCLLRFGKRAAAFGKRFLLRIYHEFNGGWTHWSGTGQPFIQAWRRTVMKIRDRGATNVGFLWSPDQGLRQQAKDSYPGDDWVDWVGISLYNWNNPNSYSCPTHPGWCEFGEIADDVNDSSTLYDAYAKRKPFITAETATVEDSIPGRKGQWSRNARDEIRARLVDLRAITYFDVDTRGHEAAGQNWRLDTSQSSLDGFRDLAADPFFNTR